MQQLCRDSAAKDLDFFSQKENIEEDHSMLIDLEKVAKCCLEGSSEADYHGLYTHDNDSQLNQAIEPEEFSFGTTSPILSFTSQINRKTTPCSFGTLSSLSISNAPTRWNFEGQNHHHNLNLKPNSHNNQELDSPLSMVNPPEQTTSLDAALASGRTASGGFLPSSPLLRKVTPAEAVARAQFNSALMPPITYHSPPPSLVNSRKDQKSETRSPRSTNTIIRQSTPISSFDFPRNNLKKSMISSTTTSKHNTLSGMGFGHGNMHHSNRLVTSTPFQAQGRSLDFDSLIPTPPESCQSTKTLFIKPPLETKIHPFDASLLDDDWLQTRVQCDARMAQVAGGLVRSVGAIGSISNAPNTHHDDCFGITCFCNPPTTTHTEAIHLLISTSTPRILVPPPPLMAPFDRRDYNDHSDKPVFQGDKNIFYKSESSEGIFNQIGAATSSHHRNNSQSTANYQQPPGSDYLCKLCNVPGHWLKDCHLYEPRHVPSISNSGTLSGGVISPSASSTLHSKRNNTITSRSSEPPGNYVCRLCGIPGHWIEQCAKFQVKTHHHIAYGNVSNSQVGGGCGFSGPPPRNYICNLCHQPGHWIQQCSEFVSPPSVFRR